MHPLELNSSLPTVYSKALIPPWELRPGLLKWRKLIFNPTPPLTNPWSYDIAFDNHEDNARMVRYDELIYQVIDGLFHVGRGGAFIIDWEVEIDRITTYGKKRVRKLRRPIIKRDWRPVRITGEYEDVDRERLPPTEIKLSRGVEFLRKVGAAAFREMGRLNPRRKFFWMWRAKLIDFMESGDVDELNVTLEWDKKAEQIRMKKVQWSPPLYHRSTAVRPALLLKEIVQFFTPGIVRALDFDLSGFAFKVRGGFIEELTCPEMYWETMKYKIIRVSINLMYGAVIDGRTEAVELEWFSPHLQPLQKITLSDRPDVPPFRPEIWTYEKVKDVLDPILMNLHTGSVQDNSYEI